MSLVSEYFITITDIFSTICTNNIAIIISVLYYADPYSNQYLYRQCAANMWYYILLALQVQMATAMIEAAEDDIRPRRKHSRYRKSFHRMLGDEERARRNRVYKRVSLLHQHSSPWRHLWNSQSDQSLITLTGLDYRAFYYLCEKFAPIFNTYSPFGYRDGEEELIPKAKTGRKRLILAEDCLGLVLAWTRTRGAISTLQLIFGMTMSNVMSYLKFGKRIIIEVLKNDDLARIALPTAEKVEQYCAAVKEKHPDLDMVWATMDGLKLALQQAPSDEVQRMFYNGWTHGHYVGSVFCFAPDGTIPIAMYNVPGCVHDSEIAVWGGVYEKLKVVYELTGARCTVDSAFNGKMNANYLLKSSQHDLVADHDGPLEQMSLEIHRKRACTSMRQSAEWGMRGLRSSFPRINDKIRWEDAGERKIDLKMMVLLFNLRSHLVGINQIRNVYMPYLETDANNIVGIP